MTKAEKIAFFREAAIRLGAAQHGTPRDPDDECSFMFDAHQAVFEAKELLEAVEEAEKALR